MTPPLSSHIAVGVEAFALLALIRGALWRSYPAFGTMLAAGFLAHVAARVWTEAYRDIWIWSTPLLIAFQAAAVFEVYQWESRRWRNTANALWWGSLVAAALLAFVSVTPRADAVAILAETQRRGAFAFTVALAAVWWVLGMRLKHSSLVLSMFAMLAVAWLPFSLSPEARAVSNDIFGYGRSALLLLWGLTIRRPDVQPPAPLDRAEAQRQAAIVEEACRIR